MGISNTGRLGNYYTRQIIETSHLEKAWLENNSRNNLISYQKYAFELIALQ